MSEELNKDVNNNEDSSSSSQALNQDGSPPPKPDAKKAVAAVLEGYKNEEDSSSSNEQKGLVVKGNETKEKDQNDSEKEELAVEEKADESKEDQDKKEDKKHESHVPYERFEEVNQKAKTFEEAATRMRGIEDFCTQNSISAEDYQEALKFVALVKTNPIEAKKLLDPIYSKLQAATGETLSDDLAKMVADGNISEDVAKMWAKDRAAKGIAENGNKLTAAQLEQKQRQEAQGRLQNAVNAWDQSKRQSDPSFKPKASPSAVDGLYEMVASRFQYYWTTTPMKTLEEVISHYDKAYNDVVAYNKQFAPRPKVKKPLTSTTSSATTEDDKDKPDFSKAGWGRKAAQKVVDALD